MTKKQSSVPPEVQQRQSRKEVLRARKQERQLRYIRLGIIGVIALVALVVLVALITESFVIPNQVVASVGDQEITLDEWQERVRYERAQRIIFLENQLEAFGGDVGIIQQFGGQAINDLLDNEGLGQTVINSMADELVICRGLEDRGITITDEDVDAEIASNFNFFSGESPTPQPSPIETVVPTPSLTPIPTAVITDVVPTETPFPTATLGPTSTPQPTSTPVSQEAFDQEYADFIAQFTDLGIDEATYRSVVRTQLCRERLQDVLAEEDGISNRAEQASTFLITSDTPQEAEQALADIQESDFLTVWNTIRSQPPTDEAATAETQVVSSTLTASELLWRTRATLEGSLGADFAEQAFTLPLNEPSEVITTTQSDGTTPSYMIIMVSGREERDLTEAEFATEKEDNLQLFIDEQLAGQLQIRDIWRNRVPTVPVLDNKFLAPPTATPVVPTIAVTVPAAETPAEEEVTPAAEATEAPAEATPETDSGE